jgi:hypothetical protein
MSRSGAPARIRLALTDSGSAPHASGDLFRMVTGIDAARVRYAGGPAALKGTIEGKSDLMFEPPSALFEPLRAGKLRALAVPGTTRALPGQRSAPGSHLATLEHSQRIAKRRRRKGEPIREVRLRGQPRPRRLTSGRSDWHP